jgi:succinoglycan biosynthesis protein ExoA
MLDAVTYVDSFFESLKKQTCYPNIQLVIAVCETDISTHQAIKTSEARFNGLVTIVQTKYGRISEGLNLCIKNAVSDYIVRVDAHTIISPAYLEVVVERVKLNPYVFAAGELHTASSGSGGVAKSIAVVQCSKIGSGTGAEFRTQQNLIQEELLVDTAAFCCMYKPTLEMISGYDESFIGSEDDELNFRARKYGVKILVVKGIKATYLARNTWREFIKQYFYYGYNKVGYLIKYKQFYSYKVLLPCAFFLSYIIALLYINHFPSQMLLLLMIIGYSLAAITLRNSLVGFLVTAISLFLMHNAYATGFIAGCLSYALRGYLHKGVKITSHYYSE